MYFKQKESLASKRKRFEVKLTYQQDGWCGSDAPSVESLGWKPNERMLNIHEVQAPFKLGFYYQQYRDGLKKEKKRRRVHFFPGKKKHNWRLIGLADEKLFILVWGFGMSHFDFLWYVNDIYNGLEVWFMAQLKGRYQFGNHS